MRRCVPRRALQDHARLGHLNPFQPLVLFGPGASPKLGCEACRGPDDRTEFADDGAKAAIRSDKNIVVRLCHVLHMASHKVRYTLGSRQYFVLHEYWSARALI